ncbi:helix-turn-helix transcriptional regulator [Bernardetia sp. ABR2-2B]|uniref:AraC family transcriptional regulator n=1 Tax=Bernardetia sp. ABR2-2B TaxID=3127472 RepID=UPI0030D5ED69
MEGIKSIEFANSSNTQFDIVKLEKIFGEKYTDHSVIKPHKISFFVIFFIEQGEGFHTIDFIDYPCSKGTLLTIRKDQIHNFCQSNDLVGALLVFTDDFLVNYLEQVEAQKSMLLFNESLGQPNIQLNDTEFNDIKQLISDIKNEYFEVNDSFQMGIIRSALHILISKLFRIKSNKGVLNYDSTYTKNFIKFQNLVENNVNNTRTVKHYAQMMGMSTKTLNTSVKQIVHKTAKDFIDEICIKQIKRLLINTDSPIKEISYTSGFDEITNFYKYFTRHTATTPEKFRSDT